MYYIIRVYKELWNESKPRFVAAIVPIVNSIAAIVISTIAIRR